MKSMPNIKIKQNKNYYKSPKFQFKLDLKGYISKHNSAKCKPSFSHFNGGKYTKRGRQYYVKPSITPSPRINILNLIDNSLLESMNE